MTDYCILCSGVGQVDWNLLHGCGTPGHYKPCPLCKERQKNKALVEALAHTEAVLDLAMEISLKYEPCGYYCDEAVGHVDHRLNNWAIQQKAENKAALAAVEAPDADT
jgi:hypothetical protein